MTTPNISAATAFANAGDALYRACRAGMTAPELAELDLLTLAGAEIAITQKWCASGLEIKIGVVTLDGANLLLQEFATQRPKAHAAH